MSFVYPIYDLDSGSDMMGKLGTYWKNYFPDYAKLALLYRTQGLEANQTFLDALATLSTLSRREMPIYRQRLWYKMTLLLGDMNAIPVSYDSDKAVYNAQPGDREGYPEGYILQYNAGDPATTKYKFPLPQTMVGAAGIIADKIVNPTALFTRGVDYDIDSANFTIRFKKNPFEDARFEQSTAYFDEGIEADTQIHMWVYNSAWEEFDLQNQFAYIFSLFLESTANNKLLLNSFWDMYMTGAITNNLRIFLSAVAGVSTSMNSFDTVQQIFTDENAEIVVTERAVYKFPAGSTVVVSVGDELIAGDPIVDTVTIYDLSTSDGNWDTLPALSLGNNFISGGYEGELMFENKLTDIDWVGINDDNKTIIRFEVSGYQEDIDRFWENVDAAGAESGTMLADLLDLRTDPATPPYPQNLPAEINPLDFIMDIMRNNLVIIRLKPELFGSRPSNRNYLDKLREVIPPQTTYLIYEEITATAEHIDLPTSSEPGGYTEEITQYDSMDPLDDEIYATATPPVGYAGCEDLGVKVFTVNN